MARTFDYHQRAEECSLRAAIASSDQVRKIWHEMEFYWRKRIEATAPAKSAKADVLADASEVA